MNNIFYNDFIWGCCVVCCFDKNKSKYVFPTKVCNAYNMKTFSLHLHKIHCECLSIVLYIYKKLMIFAM